MKRRSLIITIIVVINLLFVWSIFNMFYYKKVAFDTSEKAKINTQIVDKIYNGDGSWKWNKNEYDFYKEYSFSLNKNEIIELCKIINNSNAKYIENIRPKKWIDINVGDRNGNETIITLKQSDENDIYFEIDHKTFEGKELEKYIQKHIKKK